MKLQPCSLKAVQDAISDQGESMVKMHTRINSGKMLLFRCRAFGTINRMQAIIYSVKSKTDNLDNYTLLKQ